MWSIAMLNFIMLYKDYGFILEVGSMITYDLMWDSISINYVIS